MSGTRKIESESHELHRDIFWKGGTVNSHISYKKDDSAAERVKSLWGDSSHQAGGNRETTPGEEFKQHNKLPVDNND